ncbi:MAG TPA: hypothetical protein VIG73_00385 [Cerasibacillus sp.]|uniref:hypothetical protein n=1 Tax=Cerasibacillus sp. TaxID=2498711 RepID=UPI002F3F0B76
MASPFISIEEFHDVLQNWAGNEIRIEKIETNQHNQVDLFLQSTHYERNLHNLDDYESRYTLKLNGPGSVQGELMSATLPEEVYDIPLEPTTLYEKKGNELTITNDRAVYKLILKQ